MSVQPQIEPTSSEQQSLEDIFGPPICSYSRKQAIEDGELVDLMQEDLVGMVREAGFKYPVAMTFAAWSETAGRKPVPAGNDLKGILWDVLWMLKCAISSTRSSDVVRFSLRVGRPRGWERVPSHLAR